MHLCVYDTVRIFQIAPSQNVPNLGIRRNTLLALGYDDHTDAKPNYME